MSVKHIRGTIILVCCVLVTTAYAQRRQTSYNNYIKQYAPLAVEQMKQHNVPASITLAQGLLESGAGLSTLSRKSNNHFGIKCGGGWRGRSVRANDDAPNECFRAYRKVEDSYEDHSLFLVGNQRYASLFKLKKTDYKSWARGLKKAGYATDPSYANKLITIIETYDLYKYDNDGMSKREAKKWQKLLKKKPWLANPHDVYIANGLAYVIARDGDTFQLLGGEFEIGWKKLVKYNDLQRDYTLEEGDIIYLKEKNKKTVADVVYHEVREGDSMHSISQIYGVRLKTLYKLNVMADDHIPEVGERVWLK
ncbi:MAG: LysM peptidoglycan-binding domain-containing protein [Bacteroidaceae bacterium]|nr:LysM peptidoglycan-binding domain-containing protein [Bacteroidaceae bacterium]